MHAQLGNEARKHAWTNALSNAIQRVAPPRGQAVLRALDVSNGSLLGISLAAISQLGSTSTSVVSIDADLQAKRMFQSLWSRRNQFSRNQDSSEQDDERQGEQVTSFVVVDTLEDARTSVSNKPFNMLVSELYYTSLCARPLLGAINFWYQARALRANGVLSVDTVCVPSRVQVFACLLSTPGLVKAHGPLGSVCGYDHTSTFDQAWSAWSKTLYHYPLWQYSTTVRSNAVEVLSLDMESTSPSQSSIHELRTTDGTNTGDGNEEGYFVHAVVIWTTALAKAATGGLDVVWDEAGPGQEPSAWSERAVKFLDEPLFVPTGGSTGVVDVNVELVDVAENATPGGGGALRVVTSNARVV
jgi:hypothetical protein